VASSAAISLERSTRLHIAAGSASAVYIAKVHTLLSPLPIPNVSLPQISKSLLLPYSPLMVVQVTCVVDTSVVHGPVQLTV
jgi:hypothetical protein